MAGSSFGDPFVILGDSLGVSLLKMCIGNRPSLLVQFFVADAIGLSGHAWIQDGPISAHLFEDRCQIVDAGKNQRRAVILQVLLKAVFDALEIPPQIDDIHIVGADAMSVNKCMVMAANRQAMAL